MYHAWCYHWCYGILLAMHLAPVEILAAFGETSHAITASSHDQWQGNVMTINNIIMQTHIIMHVCTLFRNGRVFTPTQFGKNIYLHSMEIRVGRWLLGKNWKVVARFWTQMCGCVQSSISIWSAHIWIHEQAAYYYTIT